jgi:hypothetical protein
MGDSGAGFKYRIFKQKSWRPTFSVLYTATIPTATAGVGVGAIGHSAGILASKDFGLHHLDLMRRRNGWAVPEQAATTATTSPPWRIPTRSAGNGE